MGELDQHTPTTPPFRFATPDGWPTPSAEWVELHQLWEPPAGWTPVPGVPPARAGWRFWRVEPRGLLAFDGPRLGWLGLAQLGAVILLAAAIVMSIVLGLIGGPGFVAFGVTVALGVVTALVAVLRSRALCAVRSRVAAGSAEWRRWAVPDRALRRAVVVGASWMTTEQAIAAWSAESWGAQVANVAPQPGQRPRRAGRAAAAMTISLAAVGVLLAGTAQLPVFAPMPSGGQSAQVADTSGSSSDADLGEGTTTVSVTPVSLAEREPFCGAETDDVGPGSEHACFAWTYHSTARCNAAATIDFRDTKTGDVTRTVTRTFQVPSDEAVVLVETGTEAFAVPRGVVCHQDVSSHDLASIDSDADPADDAWPASCAIDGCIGWRITSDTASCHAMTVVLGAAKGKYKQDHRQVVVTEPLDAGSPTDVFLHLRYANDWGILDSVRCEDSVPAPADG